MRSAKVVTLCRVAAHFYIRIQLTTRFYVNMPSPELIVHVVTHRHPGQVNTRAGCRAIDDLDREASRFPVGTFHRERYIGVVACPEVYSPGARSRSTTIRTVITNAAIMIARADTLDTFRPTIHCHTSEFHRRTGAAMSPISAGHRKSYRLNTVPGTSKPHSGPRQLMYSMAPTSRLVQPRPISKSPAIPLFPAWNQPLRPPLRMRSCR